MKKEDTKAITPTQFAIVMPAVSPQQAVEAWKAYQELKKEIATPEDIQVIQGKEFYKKSYWRKVATFFNLSVEISDEREDKSNPTNTVYHFTQKAIAPNGRFASGTGSCEQMEKGRKNTTHNTRSTAETRAFNRAVSNLVGGGEVSAEEISDEQPQKSAYQQAQEHPEQYKQPVDEDPSVVTPEQEAQQEADEFYMSHPEMKEKPTTNSFCKVHGVEMERKFSQAKNKWYSIHRDNDQACFGFGYK